MNAAVSAPPLSEPDFALQGISPLCRSGAPPEADPDFIYRYSSVERVALVDADFAAIAAPQCYFTPTKRIVRTGANGRTLKKPREYLIPGAATATIAFLDYHAMGDGSLYIDYVTTRRELQKLGVGRRLVRLFYERIAVASGASAVHWGLVRHEAAWKLMVQMRTLFPAIDTDGKHHF